MRRLTPVLAAVNGVSAIALGTIAAHLLPDPQAKGWATTASTFQLGHAAAALAILALTPDRHGRLIALVLSIGALVFGIVLAALAFGAPRSVAAVAPVGGTLMLVGWIVLAVRFASLPLRR